MKCQHCGNEIPEGYEFCLFCGHKLEKTVTCPRCQSEISEDDAFCKHCGWKVGEEVVAESPQNIATDSSPVDESSLDVAAEPNQEQEPAEEPVKQPEENETIETPKREVPKSGKNRLKVYFLCLLALLIGIGAFYWLVPSSSFRITEEAAEACIDSTMYNTKDKPCVPESWDNPMYATTEPSPKSDGYCNGHGWVDLGLPSGTKWATMNVGASSPSDYGDYFAWGETSPKSSYDWSNLKYCLDNSGDKFSKYVTDSKYGTVDGKKELDLSDDAAYVNWGSGWRMPSMSQQNELREKCKWIWTSLGGHNGYKVVGPNGNFIFLPAAGYFSGNSRVDVRTFGSFLSRSLCAKNDEEVSCIYVRSGGVDWYNSSRRRGQSVRAVLADKKDAESAVSDYENFSEEVAVVDEISCRESSDSENVEQTSASASLQNTEITLAGAIDGKYKIHMNLSMDDYGNLTGIYYYDKYEEKKDVNFMKLAGNQNGENQLILEEYNKNGKNTGRFEFTYLPHESCYSGRYIHYSDGKEMTCSLHVQ